MNHDQSEVTVYFITPIKMSGYTIALSRDAGTGVHYGGTDRLTFERGAKGAQVPLHTSIISNFMIYQDQNLLQLFAHTKNLECFRKFLLLVLRSTLLLNM